MSTAQNTWVGTWGQSVFEMPPEWAGHRLDPGVLTIRVPVGGGGDACRVTLSNRYGTKPVLIDRVEVRLPDGSGEPFRFASATSATVPAGGVLVSDALDVVLPPGEQIGLRIHLETPLLLTSVNRVETDVWDLAPSDTSRGPATRPTFWFAGAQQLSPLPLLQRLEVRVPDEPLGLLAFGDSITAAGWPAHLTEGLQQARSGRSWGSVNAGISGNRLLRPGAGPNGSWFGEAGVVRFAENFAADRCTSDVVVLLGVNDILQPGSVAPVDEEVTASDVIDGYGMLSAAASSQGAGIHFCTLLPFGGADGATAQRQEVRQEINAWIRTSEAAAAYIDTDAAMAHPAEPERLRPDLDSGDHLHPNTAGQRKLALVISESLSTGHPHSHARWAGAS